SRDAHHPDLHSFPTRRSSDLRAAKEESRRHGVQIRARPVARQEIRPVAECARGAETEIGRCALAGERRIRAIDALGAFEHGALEDRKSTRLNSSHLVISYAVF